MAIVNRIVAGALDALLWPVRGMPPIAGLAVVSLVTAVFVLLVFKWTSQQERLAAVKRQIQAGFFEIRLFNDDLVNIARAQGGILRQTLAYLGLSIVPLLWTIVPLVLLVAHLQARYGYAPIDVGRSAIVTVTTTEAVPVTLTVPSGVRIETMTPVRVPARRETTWRLGVEREGDFNLTVIVDSARDGASATNHVTKRLVVRGPASAETGATGTSPGAASETADSHAIATEALPLAPVRQAGSVLDALLWPAEAPVPHGSRVASIAIDYPPRAIAIAGIEVHWLIVFAVLSTLFAFVLRRPLGVTI